MMTPKRLLATHSEVFFENWQAWQDDIISTNELRKRLSALACNADLGERALDALSGVTLGEGARVKALVEAGHNLKKALVYDEDVQEWGLNESDDEYHKFWAALAPFEVKA